MLQGVVHLTVQTGAIQTPQILELSGIGDPAILSEHGIPSLIDLPGVGENLRRPTVSSYRLQLLI